MPPASCVSPVSAGVRVVRGEEPLADFADCTVAADAFGDPMGMIRHAFPGIGDGDGEADMVHAWDVVDIVADICDVASVHTSLAKDTLQCAKFVGFALDAVEFEFVAAGSHHGIGLGGEDKHGGLAKFAEHADAQTVAAIGEHTFGAVLHHEDLIGREDAVKVEDEQGDGREVGGGGGRHAPA